MKRLIIPAMLIALCSFRYFGDIYSITIKTLDGEEVELNIYRGKKMMFIILPLSIQDTSVSINELNDLQAKYTNSLVVIGVPAEESGFKKGEEGKLKKLYVDQKSNFIITQGMKVKKSSGSVQSSIFQMLTNKDKNSHFNSDAQGPGQKYFVDETGNLYAVMGPEIKLSNPVITRILEKPPTKKDLAEKSIVSR